MYSSCKRSISRNTTWSAIHLSLQRNIPEFDTVLLHSNWSSLRRKYLSKTPTDVNVLSCGTKTWNISGISDAFSPARHPQKSSQHAQACAAGDGAICSKNRIIVPYHADKPNTWNSARLRSPSPIIAPVYTKYYLNSTFQTLHDSIQVYSKKIKMCWWNPTEILIFRIMNDFVNRADWENTRVNKTSKISFF